MTLDHRVGGDLDPLPPYTFVPGGPWPHPARSPNPAVYENVKPIRNDAWRDSAVYLSGVRLFNAGYYWEAHEAWEALWHAHGRRGQTADLLRGLIKLAAAGVKARERQPHGIVTHASRAATWIESSRLVGGDRQLGIDLPSLIRYAHELALEPPIDAAPAGAAVSKVLPFEIDLR
jgi:uncharacterized protein